MIIPDDPLTVTLPFPPSYNRYFRGTRNGNYISKEGMAFKAAAEEVLCALDIEPLVGAVCVCLDYYRPRRTGDLDNLFKQVLDALQGHAYANDSQIVEIRARRFEDKLRPRVEIAVYAANELSGNAG